MRPRIVHHYKNRAGEEIKLVLKGHTYRVGDCDVDLFKIKSLASIFSRTPTTIRQWEAAGKFPEAKYRGTEGKRVKVFGIETFMRFYSREQLEMIIEVLEKYKFYQRRRDRAMPDEMFQEIRDKFYVCDEVNA